MSELLDSLEMFELDFHHAFRRLGAIKLSDVETEDQRKDVAGRFFKKDSAPRQESEGRERLGKWLEKWAARVKEDWGEGKDDERKAAMDAVNPNVSFNFTRSHRHAMLTLNTVHPPFLDPRRTHRACRETGRARNPTSDYETCLEPVPRNLGVERR
jgi:uncharacterized protein YdiU (UPF0061 family)